MRNIVHPIQKVSAFRIAGPYPLQVTFADGLSRTIAFQPILKSELFGPLRDLNLFDAVTIDPEVHTLVWPNGADFDPATLHDWPDHQAHLIALANTWETR
jgi:hypothetical protein